MNVAGVAKPDLLSRHNNNVWNSIANSHNWKSVQEILLRLQGKLQPSFLCLTTLREAPADRLLPPPSSLLGGRTRHNLSRRPAQLSSGQRLVWGSSSVLMGSGYKGIRGGRISQYHFTEGQWPSLSFHLSQNWLSASHSSWDLWTGGRKKSWRTWVRSITCSKPRRGERPYHSYLNLCRQAQETYVNLETQVPVGVVGVGEWWRNRDFTRTCRGCELYASR